MEVTWRELLGKIAEDPQEQQRILDVLSINAMTLKRWVNGETNPRPQNLRLLLNALPHHRKQLLMLLPKEFPFLQEGPAMQSEGVATIPSDYYAQVLTTYTGVSQHLRYEYVSKLLLNFMLKQLDPNMEGLIVFIAQCVPPNNLEQRVRSLRLISGRGTPPWSSALEYRPQFFGAESPIGYAVSSGHSTVIHNKLETLRLFPDSYIENVESIVASPIVLANQVVGGVYVGSTQPAYFTQSYLTLIQKYVELMCLAFDKDDFYLFSDIALGVMPSTEAQLPILKTFQQRVTQYILQAARDGRAITRLRAERQAWQELEEALFFAIKTLHS